MPRQIILKELLEVIRESLDIVAWGMLQCLCPVVFFLFKKFRDVGIPLLKVYVPYLDHDLLWQKQKDE